jgi:hypothetical protein
MADEGDTPNDGPECFPALMVAISELPDRLRGLTRQLDRHLRN